MVNSYTPTFTPSYLDNLLPSNIEAEESILGSLLLDGRAINIIAEKLPVEAFYVQAHQKIYRAIHNLYKQQRDINLLSVTAYLEDKKQLESIGGRNKLASLFHQAVSSATIESMADLVLEKYIRRSSIGLGNEIVAKGFEGLGSSLDLVKYIEEKTLSFTKAYATGEDSTMWKYDKLIERIRNIELTVCDPGYKLWKLQALASEFCKSTRELEQLYLKSLADFSQQSLKGLRELDEECGSEDREWLLYGFLPKATTILFHAEGGVGKTKMVYELAYNLITGKSWSGFPVTASQRKVLFYQTDESPHDMRQALRARGFNQDMEDNFKYRTNWVIDAIPQLVKDIQDFKPDFIVIDSLTSVSRYSVFEENSTEYARPLLQLVQIAAQYKCTIMVIHHSNAEGRARGTRAIRNSVSEVWQLKEDNSKSADGLERILEIEKSRSRSRAKYRLRFDPEDYSWHLLEKEGEELGEQTVKDKIVKFLSQNRNVAFESEEIARQIGAAHANVRRFLNLLKQDGAISRKEKGEGGDLGYKGRPYLYFIAADGEFFPDSDPPPNADRASQSAENHDQYDQKVSIEKSIVSANDDHGVKMPITTDDQNNLPEESRVPSDADREDANFSKKSSEENPQKTNTHDHKELESPENKENILIIDSDHQKKQDDREPDHNSSDRNSQPPQNQLVKKTVPGTLGDNTATISLIKEHKKYITVRIDYFFADGTKATQEAHPSNQGEAEIIAYNYIEKREHLSQGGKVTHADRYHVRSGTEGIVEKPSSLRQGEWVVRWDADGENQVHESHRTYSFEDLTKI